jgi:hypothetical protein
MFTALHMVMSLLSSQQHVIPLLSCSVLSSPFFSRCSFSHWRHVSCRDCPQVVVPPVCSCRYASSRLDFTLLFSNYFLWPCCMRELIMSRRKYKSLLALRPRHCKSREGSLVGFCVDRSDVWNTRLRYKVLYVRMLQSQKTQGIWSWFIFWKIYTIPFLTYSVLFWLHR